MNIEYIYKNLLLLSISRGYDFNKAMIESENEIKYLLDDNNCIFPKGYEGLLFIETMLQKIGSNLGEVYYFSDQQREDVIRRIISNVDYDCAVINNDSTIEYDIDEVKCKFSVMVEHDITAIAKYYQDINNKSVLDADIYIDFILVLKKYTKKSVDRIVNYSMIIKGADEFESEYMYGELEIWSGTEGFIADFIEDTISNCNNDLEEIDEDFEEEFEEEKYDNRNINENSFHEKIEVEKPVITSEISDPASKIVDELVKYIDNQTRTVDLLINLKV